MTEYVLGFEQIDRTMLASVGGKGANLGELSRIGGVRVPEGFCVTTDAYARVVAGSDELAALLQELSQLGAADTEGIREIGARIRQVIEAIPVPSDIADEIGSRLAGLGEQAAYAVRSSATAEDLPTASFAGQQDTYLNVSGRGTVLRHVRRCWASLFTDRAITYRLQNGIDHRGVRLAVVVQRMVFPDVAGIMFTADPITSNRKVISIDAGFGLGEALVSGLANADNYKVRDGEIVDRLVTTQAIAVRSAPGGGTVEEEIAADRQGVQKLTDADILRLAGIGRTIEAHFGRPQDVEWSFAEDTFYIVQSRPVTTLFPIPGPADGKNHVYISFGHQQMMTDAMKPLGLSFFEVGFGEAALIEAGGRLYGDLAPDLASAVGRRLVPAAMGRIDPLMDSAVKQLMKRPDFMKGLARGGRRYLKMNGAGYLSWRLPVEAIRLYRSNDPDVVPALMARDDEEIDALRRKIERLSGDDLFEFVVADLELMKKAMYDPRSMAVVYVGMYALNWINKHLEKWLGVKGAGDALTKSVKNNVTSKMGFALLDVAETVRAHPAVMDALPQLTDATFFAELSAVEGGDKVGRSIREFLDRYGMRCSGEIDITRPRWIEEPSALVPAILSQVKNLESNARAVRDEQGRQETEDLRRTLMERLERLPGGRRKARRTRKMIGRLRNFAGYREYPKYLMMRHYWILKQALLREASKLVERGVVRRRDDVYYLSFAEFREAARTGHVDQDLITRRAEEFEAWARLTPPRVITSDGEVLAGAYAANRVPAGALAGIPASAGRVEGRARIVRDLTDAHLEEGDILVTTFTDPSWTPVFLSVEGVVTEVGGAMTHGAVVAREYGLPAVVGVDGATPLIRDKQPIRVDGTEGYVEIL
ncbi:MAG TPA: rifamycin-inactivating phosphotransferase [Streptosporangiales bacterium]